MNKEKEVLEFGVYTLPIVDEAKSRGIQVRGFLDVNQNNAILTYKGHTEWIAQAFTNGLGKVTDRFLHNKVIVNRLLKEAGMPVSNQIFTNDFEEVKKFLKKKKHIVIKPSDRSGGKGITTRITLPRQLKAAFKKAQRYTWKADKKVICEKYIEGEDNRVLIIDKKHIFGVQRIPAYVVGDGESTIKQLVKEWNQTLPVENRKINLGKTAKKMLRKQNLRITSIPRKGQNVRLGVLGNSHQGAISVDTTNMLGAETKKIVRKIAKMFDVPVLGVDFLSPDISRTPGRIIELNTYPGLTIHHQPTLGKQRDPSSKIIDMLFPETKRKRR